MGKRSTVCKFPVARIKKIMQADEDVGKVAAATPVAVCKALELFMENIMEEAVKEARSKGSKKVTAYHLKRTVHRNETFDFLKEIVSKVADPTETTTEGDTRGGKRRKTSNTVGKATVGPSGSTSASGGASTAGDEGDDDDDDDD
ncbi:histone-fold-containing protein [Tilletiaria anomala UBC 951]|uniref:Histone-fold-containing protein n=1 Tax=Tilletiaria anomala (strain ATCC 24038 / CBS 436.72 / UBC 951) TaxID=1037660 RepID=A0A066VXZ2_TILAU|nr:histone-fold-containing protein [Tilletiaria anomala UBC 951]KDN43694.1 histone-fold-containing protein [Tilletiaria anomala UBC 951]